MSTNQPAIEIDYPESDGKPMGETDWHRNWIIRLIDILQTRYRGQQVYVTGDLLLYYEEGNPKRFLVPDVFVVLDHPPGLRRVYKLWEEGKPPNAIIEVTSRRTKREDANSKPDKYAKIGVEEYFLFDPTSDYLRPPLRGLSAKTRAASNTCGRREISSRTLLIPRSVLRAISIVHVRLRLRTYIKWVHLQGQSETAGVPDTHSNDVALSARPMPGTLPFFRDRLGSALPPLLAKPPLL